LRTARSGGMSGKRDEVAGDDPDTITAETEGETDGQ